MLRRQSPIFSVCEQVYFNCGYYINPHRKAGFNDDFVEKALIRTYQNIEKEEKRYQKHFQKQTETLANFTLKSFDNDKDALLEFDLESTELSSLNYIKDLWKVANDSTKETMWKYFLIFDKL